MRLLLILLGMIRFWVTHTRAELSSTTEYSIVPGPLVNISYGSVQGVRLDGDIEAFLGVPFGRPPVGELRFTKAQPVTPWQGVLKADRKRFGCPQADQWLSRHLHLYYVNHSSEDCLSLNIWRPAVDLSTGTVQEGLKPVFVFIYGGSFQWGSSDLFLYDGRAFAATNGVIFVSISYRVGLLGFAHHPDLPELTGTAGLWDQNLALRWVRDNIALFGGDPAEVTVCGHSAGAISAALHAISPHAKGLFRRLIVQSGTSLSLNSLSKIPRNELSKVAESLGCEGDARDQLNCLRAIDVRELVQAADRLGHEGMALPPVYSDYASFDPTKLENAEFNIEQIIIGTNEQEASIFAKRAFDKNENLRRLILGVGYMASMVGILRAVFHTPLAESRRIVNVYFTEEREYSEDEVTQLVAEAATDLFFTCPAQFYSEAAVLRGVNVFRYFFRHRPSYSLYEDIPGVLHGEELPFTLGNLPSLKDLLMEDSVTKADETVENLTYTPFEEKLLEDIQQLWGSFTRGGIPLLSNGRSWPRFTTSREVYLDISDSGISVRRGIPKVQRCLIWKSVVMQKAPSARFSRKDDYSNSYEDFEEDPDTKEVQAASSAKENSPAKIYVLVSLVMALLIIANVQ
ncbi:acetylcholinesterase-like [Tropilaelaps mercedesae]|uniref:Carboxylic ester hydrolase n=1 Tax=Tropilaelaps mercedesae TaxID=418985 RepID=A0A1V9XEX7_9ACAR|nr:acetylcholinesterase-like [Tropilaelaps mercedesae]